MKKRYLILFFLGGIILAYMLGPRPTFPEFDGKISPLNISIEKLDAYLQNKESKIANIKLENEGRIIWADSVRKTPYSIVYLHGFSAGPMEADPIHFEMAKRYGCNLHLARLAQHGIDDTECFNELTPKQLVESAKEAIAVANLIGEKTIVMSCSTGGTFSAYLAAHNPELIDAQILFSPNFALSSSVAKLMTMPWGRQITKSLAGDYRDVNMPQTCAPYWTLRYRLEGIIALQSLLEETMTDETFSKITQPAFLGYYYKNEEEKDGVISIERINQAFDLMQTPAAQKRNIAFSTVGAHVMVSHLQSKDLDAVRKELFSFSEEVLQLKPVVEKESAIIF